MELIQAPEQGLFLPLLWSYILTYSFHQQLLIRVCYKECQQQSGTLLIFYVGRFELGH